MKHILFITLILSMPTISRSDEGPVAGAARVAYSVDLTHIKVQPTEKADGGLLDKRIPGAGRILKEWHLRKIDEHVFQLSGTVHCDNAYFPAKDAAVLLGNIAVCDMLRLIAKTDAAGRFSVRIDNRTFYQIQKAAGKDGYSVVRMDSTEPDDQATIYLKRKYLYLGDSNVDLYRYEIPYKEAEQAGPGYPPQGVGSPDP